MANALRPIVISGPSGGGKSTLLERLFANNPNSFAFSVSHTTRKPRPGEVHGKSYYFVEKDDMRKMINNNEFLEWAEFAGNLYGTSRKAVNDIQQTNKICVLDVEIQGVKAIKKTDLKPVYIFIKPPSLDELERRLRNRGTENEDSLQKRLKTAATDMASVESDLTLFDFIVINDDLDKALNELQNILQKDIESIKSQMRKER